MYYKWLCFVIMISGCVCVCVCVSFPSILDIKFVGRTSQGHTGGRSHRISHPPSFCGACLNFSREKDSAISFPRRPWSRILCILFFIFLVIKIPFAGIELTSQRVKGLRGTSELPGRPAVHGDYYKCTVQRWASPRHHTVDPRLLPLGNPVKYHVVVLYL